MRVGTLVYDVVVGMTVVVLVGEVVVIAVVATIIIMIKSKKNGKYKEYHYVVIVVLFVQTQHNRGFLIDCWEGSNTRYVLNTFKKVIKESKFQQNGYPKKIKLVYSNNHGTNRIRKNIYINIYIYIFDYHGDC